MPQPVPYKIYLMPDDSNYYYVDASGAVATSGTSVEINYMPINWKDIELGVERGWVYYGLLTNFTSAFQFVVDGAEICRHIFNTYGYEGKCTMRIYTAEVSNYSYNTFFEVDLDFTTYVDNYDYVSIAGIDNAFSALLKSRDNTEYEIDIDGNADIRFIEHDGIDLQCRMRWHGIPAEVVPDYTPTIMFLDNEGTNLWLTPYDLGDSFNPKFVENTSANTVVSTLNVNYDLLVDTFSVVGNSYLYIQVREVEVSTSTLISVTDIFTGTPQSANTIVQYTGIAPMILTINPDRYYGINFRMWDGSGWIASTEYNISSIQTDVILDFANRYPTTYIPCLRLIDVCKQLIEKINTVEGSPLVAGLTVISDMLETDYNNEHFIFSGDAARRLKGCKLKLDLSKLFRYINSKFGCALIYKKEFGELYIEKKSAAFVNSVNAFVSIDTVVNLTARPLTQEVFNNLNIGNEEATYNNKGDNSEVTNGKDEFNTLNKYLTPSLKVNKTADYVSPFSNSMFEIEQVRANLDGKTIADADSDNKIFGIHCNATSSTTYTDEYGNTGDVHTIYRDAISIGVWEIQNIYNIEDGYNIFYSPTRCIKRNGAYFRAIFKFDEAKYFEYQSSSKTNQGALKMVTLTGGVVDFDEGADQLISIMCNDGEEYFYPIVVEFDTSASKELFYYMADANEAYKYLRFTYLGNEYYGYLFKASFKPANMGKTKLSLLLTIDNDVTKFIR